MSLPQIIGLSTQWECGLVEMQYSHSWYNAEATIHDLRYRPTLEKKYDIHKGVSTPYIMIGTNG